MRRSIFIAALELVAACGGRAATMGTSDEGGESSSGSQTDGGETGVSTSEGPILDVGEARPDPQIDFLFVIDNSPSMRDEQRNVASNLLAFWEELAGLEDFEGEPGFIFDASLHLMVTTTDLGGPLCPNIDGYAPAQGAPVTEGCNARITEFSAGEVDVTDACTDVCPSDVVPAGSFIRTEIGGASNVPNDDVGAALACLGAQGVVGCEYGQPLEAMLRALNPEAPWNQGSDPFLRDASDLVVVLVTDQPDCSVADPAIFQDAELMNSHPDTGQPTPSHAICWNALATCTDQQVDGSYSDCSPSDTGMHAVERYVGRLRDELVLEEERVVIMLAALGVPEVTSHAEDPPFQPTGGGIFNLVYRDWMPGGFPAGDVLPDHGPTAAHEQWRHGIGPGCTGMDGQGGFLGQATPPIRANEVCGALDQDGAPRCCVESVCDADFSVFARCLYFDFQCPLGSARDGERCIPPG